MHGEGPGDRDRDGFQEYKTRSSHGHYNQGWKDAWDGIPHADGTLAPLPLALCEIQGYEYDARLRMADILDVLERPDAADRQRRKAARLFDRLDDPRAFAAWHSRAEVLSLGDDLEARQQAVNDVLERAELLTP